jgi:hypothetical protein
MMMMMIDFVYVLRFVQNPVSETLCFKQKEDDG